MLVHGITILCVGVEFMCGAIFVQQALAETIHVI